MARVFRGGIPYSVDARRLMEAFPVPSLTEGRIIKHEQLEGILAITKGSQRYYAVINSWIAQMKHANGLFLVWEPGLGLRVLDPAGILSFAENRTRQKIRQTGKAVRNFGWVDRNRLDTLGQQRLDHQLRVVSTIETALNSARKDLAVGLAPIKSLPKPRLLQQA